MRTPVVWWVAATMLVLVAVAASAQPGGPARGAAPMVAPSKGGDGPADFADADDLFGWVDDDGEDLAWGGPLHGGMGMHGGPGMHGGMGGPGAMHHGPGGPGGMQGGRLGLMPRVLSELGLSDAQRERIVELHERQARASIQARADLATAALDLHKLVRADRPDRAAIDRQIERLGQIRTDMQKSHVGTMLEVRSVLTPEQEAKLKELRGHLRQGRAGRGSPWGDRDDSRDVEKPKR